LTSLNASWVYATFGEDDGLRAGQWIRDPNTTGGSGGYCYTANRVTNASPWTEIGVSAQLVGFGSSARFYLYNPCGITAANFTNGEKYAIDLGGWTARIQSIQTGAPWVDEYTITQPSSASTWESWSQNETLISGSRFVGIYVAVVSPGTANNLEAADCTITVTNPPTCTLGSEQANYPLAVTITNETTGEAVTLTFTMEVNQELELNTDAGTVTYLKDGQVHMEALTVVSGPRLDWLPLAPGSNTLRFDDTGTNAVTVTITWEIRYY